MCQKQLRTWHVLYEHVFHFLNCSLKGRIPQNKQQLEEAMVQAWKTIKNKYAKDGAIIISKG